MPTTYYTVFDHAVVIEPYDSAVIAKNLGLKEAQRLAAETAEAGGDPELIQQPSYFDEWP